MSWLYIVITGVYIYIYTFNHDIIVVITWLGWISLGTWFMKVGCIYTPFNVVSKEQTS